MEVVQQITGKSDFYFPFAKVDVAQRMVYGWASTPTKDLQNEIVTLDAIKNALPEYLPWSNIREMHQPSAVGVCKHAEIIEGGDREHEGLYIAAKIVDDAAWVKVQEGVYRGFSIGGEKLEKTGDTVTKLKLYEISIVDRPANPECRIDYFKAVGLERSSMEVGGADVVFDRREMTWAARIIAKFAGIGKAEIPKPEDWGRDGFSKPAPAQAPVDHGNIANTGALQPSEPLPEIITQPSDTPMPSSDAYLDDVPPRDRNRILLMSGKAHVFKRDGSHLGSFPGDDAGKKAAIEALKAYLADADAEKMLGKAVSKALKIAKRDRKMLLKALERNEDPEIKKAILDTLKAKGLQEPDLIKKTPEPITLSKDITDRIAALRGIQADIVAEGTDEGGDPKDFEQAKEIGEVIADLRGDVLGEPESIDSLFSGDEFPQDDDEDATLYAA